ncbi:MAG: DEAD/DEAH box helicase [Planctomycetes bacterium]|nr:DEAD/DEAH box helicase [Planctomycetota bacterium]
MDDFFNTDVGFESFGLSDDLLRGIKELGFEHPTKVQAALIPPALAGKDVIAQSKTGTGKTVAFGLPLLQLIERKESLAAIILVPTRELAIQVTDELRNLSQFSPMKVLAIYGGQKISIQTERLKRNPNIIVGTPGRVMDMHGRGLLPYDNMRFAVLDEVDEMLDIGFRDDIRKILGSMSHKRQTIFVSATISPEIERLARQYMKDPEKLIVSQGKSLTVDQVQQSYFSVEPWDKKRLLLHLLRHEEPTLTLTFCRTKQTVDALAEYLVRKGIEAHAIHGDMYQGKRTRIMKLFKSGGLGVLVASDLAARGLDVKDITHVINYDLPEDPEIYVHRIGRTARVGKDGFAWSFATPEQGHLLSNIERLTNVEIPLNEYEDFEPGPLPAAVIAKRELHEQREAERTTDNSRVRSAPPAPDEARDTSKFPGGKVPAALPARRMGGRVRTRRR